MTSDSSQPKKTAADKKSADAEKLKKAGAEESKAALTRRR